MRTRNLLAGLLLVAVLSIDAYGQEVRGRVAVIDIADAIPDAIVIITDSAGIPHTAVRSDSAGWFSATVPFEGQFILQVYKTGFRPTTSAPIALKHGTVTEVRVNLRPVAVTLPGVTIYGEGPYAAFHRRKGERRGFLVDRLDIERIKARHLGDLVREAPLADGKCWGVWLDGRPVSLWVKNWLMGAIGGAAYPPDWYYGVEIYPNKFDAPPEYRGDTSHRCGVILAWSKSLEP